MRKRFEQQYSLGIKKIEDTEINLKSRDGFPKMLLALKYLYVTPEHNEKIFSILEKNIIFPKNKTGRKGMNLWQIFVLAQARMVKNLSYDELHDLAQHHSALRQILGIRTSWEFENIVLGYQNIVDNVKLLDDSMLNEINAVIVEMGHQVYKKKEPAALCLKTDSFVVESNVHYPTDYNLLWDSARKIIDSVQKLLKKYDIPGWRKINSWYRELKNMMRAISQSSKKKEESRKKLISDYLKKAKLFSEKIHNELKNLPLNDNKDLSIHLELDYYIEMLDKHIDLLERRVIKGEKIPHSEKTFSIFEPYSEWITKGKRNPSFEIGKNLSITTDQFHLIVNWHIMEHETDSEIITIIADKILKRYKVSSWSFDKGFFSKENKELLALFIDKVVMPKKGKPNKKEYQEEHEKGFKRLRNKHSAVESNINELEHRGLSRCPDRGYQHFKNYVGQAICAYNLHRIGAELLRQERLKLKQAA